MVPQVGDRAPEFILPSPSNGDVALTDLLRRADRLIVAFYPKDNTSG